MLNEEAGAHSCDISQDQKKLRDKIRVTPIVHAGAGAAVEYLCHINSLYAALEEQ